MKLEVDSSIWFEVMAVAHRYDAERAGLGDEFIDAIDDALELIRANPQTWPVWPGIREATPPIQRYIMSRFPYAIGYQAFADRIDVDGASRPRPGRGRARQATSGLLALITRGVLSSREPACRTRAQWVCADRGKITRMRDARRASWVVMVMAMAMACGGGQRGSSGTRSGWYVVEFPSARLIARRPDGKPWHVAESDNTAVLIGGLIGLAAGNPMLGVTLGEAASDPGGDPLAPAPYIDLKIEGATYRIAPVGRTYAPAWDQPVALDARRWSGDENVVIQVRDAVDDSVIAQHEIRLAELLAQPTQTLTRVGPVASLDVVVREVMARKRAEYRVTVPSTVGHENLVKQGSPGWQAIPVWNGDMVTIEAGGSVCPSSKSECFSPAGAEPGRWQSYSFMKEARHAALVAAVPGEVLEIGKARTFRVAQSGHLLLLVNDTDVDNNSGAFEACVVVTPPQ